MRRVFAIASALALLTIPTLAIDTHVLAAPPDRAVLESRWLGADEEARAGMCGDFDGIAFTFCVALCEARQCDRRPASDGRCTLLRRGFARATGGTSPPCGG